MNGGRGREPDRLSDVAHGRRIAVLADIALDEVEDLLLTLREVQLDHSDAPWGRFRCRNPNMCSQSTQRVGRHQGRAPLPASTRGRSHARLYTQRSTRL